MARDWQLFWLQRLTNVSLSPGCLPKEVASEAEPEPAVRAAEEQRDSSSPHSADSPMSMSSPRQHSSASSVSSLSGSDNVSPPHPTAGHYPRVLIRWVLLC